MKVLYITTDWNTPYRIATGEYGGVGYYRAHGPAKALRKKGWDIDVMGYELNDHIDKEDMLGSYKKLFKPYSLVVIKQADTANVAQLIGACKDLEIPIAMDLDDLITELDPDNPALDMGYGEGGTKQAFAIAALSMVDALFVSTQPLADEYEKFLKLKLQMKIPTYILPNCCDADLWSKQKKRDDGKITIGWQGSITHDNDLRIVVPAIQKIMEKNKDVLLSLTGGVRQDTYDEMFVKTFPQDALDRVIVNRGTQSFKNFPEYMSRHKWNIGIIPLKDTKFSRGKSHIKWMENSLLGVPTIASDVYPYREPIHGVPVIQDSETGILCKDNEWEEKIEALILDKQKRHYLARDARKFVLNNWQYKHHIHRWEEAIASVVKEGSKSLR